MQEIRMPELDGIRKNLKNNELILDVRTPEEFKSGHVPGSRNIPFDEVEKHAADLKKYARIYIHCQAGVRALKATDALTRMGLANLVCVTGSGMGDWIQAGLPIER